MNYLKFTIALADEFHEYLIAELMDLDFEGFEELEDSLIATIPANRFDDYKREELERLVFNFDSNASVQEEIVQPQNWNQTWEKTIKPQVVGRFYVRPTWESPHPKNDLIDLIIDPKLAFGTGYHPTTRLMLEAISEVVEEGDEVLDAGTGTGILGIAALKVGAKSVFGFDIDEWSKDNAYENIQLNKVENFEVELGSIEVIPEGAKYDVILANINRNILINLMPTFVGLLKPRGRLLLSGLLDTDEEKMLELPSLLKVTYMETKQQLEWISILFKA